MFAYQYTVYVEITGYGNKTFGMIELLTLFD